MNLEFIVNENYILLKMLCNVNDYTVLNNWRKDIIDKDVLNTLINDVNGKVEEYYSRGYFDNFIKRNNIEKVIDKIKEDNLFKKYYQKAINYMENIKVYWLDNKDKINEYLKNIIKLELDTKAIKVYITHPHLNAGICVDNKNIFFGHLNGLKDINYNIVYLCHEYLHLLLPNKKCNTPAMKMYYDKAPNGFNKEHWNYLLTNIDNYYENFDYEEKIIHSIIELISDNELYTRLSGESKYSLGHNDPNYSLVNYKNILLSYWFKYIKLNKDEIMLRKENYIDNNITLDNSIIDINLFINYILSNNFIREKLNIRKIGSVKNTKK